LNLSGARSKGAYYQIITNTATGIGNLQAFLKDNYSEDYREQP
jgi:hypothetical protein